jgi:hypothetical protein
MEKLTIWEEKGECGRGVGGKYNQSTLYACTKLSQWDLLFCTFNIW